MVTYPLALKVSATRGSITSTFHWPQEVTCTWICPISHGSQETGNMWRMAPTIGLWERVYRWHAEVPGTQQEPSACHVPPEKCPCPLESFPPTSSALPFEGDYSAEIVQPGDSEQRNPAQYPQTDEELCHASQDFLVIFGPEHISTAATAKLEFTYMALTMCQAPF